MSNNLLLIGTDGNPITRNDLVLDLRDVNRKITILVPYPSNYPDTLFKQTNKEGILARLHCSIRNNNMFLHAFYVYASKTMGDTNEQERYLVRGLGKNMLCTAVNYAYENNYLNEDSIIELEASGGVCNFLDDSVRRQLENWTDDELDQFLTHFPEDVENAIYDLMLINKTKKRLTIPRETKIEMACVYYANQNLVNYYKTFGLSVDDEHITYVSMKGDIKSVLKACSSSFSFGSRKSRKKSGKSRKKSGKSRKSIKKYKI